MTAITPTVAAHVLHHFGEGGVRAGSFTVRLVDLITYADPANRTKLALGFPGYVAAVDLAQNRIDGIAALRYIAAEFGAEAAAGPCCDLHNTNCEPPSELCCHQCTEADHPRHPPGIPCVLTPEPHPTRRDLDRMEGP